MELHKEGVCTASNEDGARLCECFRGATGRYVAVTPEPIPPAGTASIPFKMKALNVQDRLTVVDRCFTNLGSKATKPKYLSDRNGAPSVSLSNHSEKLVFTMVKKYTPGRVWKGAAENPGLGLMERRKDHHCDDFMIHGFRPKLLSDSSGENWWIEQTCLVRHEKVAPILRLSGQQEVHSCERN